MNRALGLARFAKIATPVRGQIRKSGHYMGYRELNYDPTRKFQSIYAEILGGVMYWWIGWNLMTDWRHLIGEFIWPERSKWSDEELGVTKD